jgi:hypothetical protein
MIPLTGSCRSMNISNSRVHSWEALKVSSEIKAWGGYIIIGFEFRSLWKEKHRIKPTIIRKRFMGVSVQFVVPITLLVKVQKISIYPYKIAIFFVLCNYKYYI